MWEYNTWVVMLGTSLLGAGAGLVGTYAVLRQRALTGDALAHAALPGLCLAFLIIDERDLPRLLLGALVSGLIGVGCISLLRRMTRIKEDAAVGAVLSVFFGAGLVLSRVVQDTSTSASKAGLDTFILNQAAGMVLDDVRLLAIIGAFSLVTILLFAKEFLVVIFDPSFAASQGWPVLRLDLTLMGLIAVMVVGGLPAVGAVMVAALLILPAATARFWTNRFDVLLVLAALFGAAIGPIGTFLSATIDRLPTGPTIVLVGTGLFLASVIAAPRRGVIALTVRRLQLQKRMRLRSLLRTADMLADPTGRGSLSDLKRPRDGWSLARWRGGLAEAERRGWIVAESSEVYALSDKGRRLGAEASRTYRLWESALVGYPELATVLGGPDDETWKSVLSDDQIDRLVKRIDRAEAGVMAGSTSSNPSTLAISESTTSPQAEA